MKYTIFEIYEATITEAHRHYMNNHFSYHHLKWPGYKKRFFERNPDAPKEDYYSWMAHYQCENWEEDIIWMDDEQFKYHWPIHYGYITRIHSEEESNRNGPPSDQG